MSSNTSLNLRNGISFTIAVKYPSNERSPLELRYRFADTRIERGIGVSVSVDEWNKRQECLHQNDERQKKVQAIKDAINGINRSLYNGKSISLDGIKTILDNIIFGDTPKKVVTPKQTNVVGEIWKKFYDLSFKYKNGGSAYVSMFHRFVQNSGENLPTSKHFESWVKQNKPIIKGQVLIALLAKEVMGESWVRESGSPLTIDGNREYAKVKLIMTAMTSDRVTEKVGEACFKAGLPAPKLKRGTKKRVEHTTTALIKEKNGKKVVEVDSLPKNTKKVIVSFTK